MMTGGTPISGNLQMNGIQIKNGISMGNLIRMNLIITSHPDVIRIIEKWPIHGPSCFQLYFQLGKGHLKRGQLTKKTLRKTGCRWVPI